MGWLAHGDHQGSDAPPRREDTLTGPHSPIVLVHGAWHGPWCWDHVTPLLDARGISWSAVDLPSMDIHAGYVTDVHADAAALRAALDLLDEPAIVVGHSYGGMVITEGAAAHPNVRHLMYLAAFMPDKGQSLNDLTAQVPNPALAAALRFDHGGRMTVTPELVGPCFYNDCDGDTVRWASERLRPMLSRFSEPVRATAWRDVPSTYVVCAQDYTIPPDLQRLMAKHASRVVEWDTSHSPFASRPELVAELLASLSARA